jgi:hypothetical protein
MRRLVILGWLAAALALATLGGAASATATPPECAGLATGYHQLRAPAIRDKGGYGPIGQSVAATGGEATGQVAAAVVASTAILVWVETDGWHRYDIGAGAYTGTGMVVSGGEIKVFFARDTWADGVADKHLMVLATGLLWCP